MSEVGDPQGCVQLEHSSLQHGRFTFGYQMRWIGKQIISDEETGLGNMKTISGFQGTASAKCRLCGSHLVPKQCSITTSGRGGVGPKYNFYIGYRQPDRQEAALQCQPGCGGGSSIYEVKGRFFYAGAVAKF